MQAIPYAIFLLIEDDVRETENEHLEALFVEAFGDRQSFFNICIKELEKAESIIELHMDRTNLVERFDGVTDDDGQEDEAIPESKDDKIYVILDLFKDKGLVTLTKYVKVFTQGNVQFLAIAHAKVNADFEKLFKKLKFEPDDDHIKHVKSFTKPSGEEMAGKGSMITTREEQRKHQVPMGWRSTWRSSTHIFWPSRLPDQIDYREPQWRKYLGATLPSL